MPENCSELFLSNWKKSGQKLGFNVFTSVSIKLSDGSSLIAPVHLPNFGNKNGILLFTKFDEIENVAEKIFEAGYGYSVLSEPSSENEDLDVLIEVLSDWGWFGPEKDHPKWLET